MAMRPPPRGRVARPGPGISSKQQLSNALVAAAENLNKTLEAGGSQQIGENWQQEIKALFYKVPELRTASRITGRAMSQCRLVIAKVDANGEPIPLDVGTKDNPGPDAKHPAAVLLNKFAGGPGGQAALLDQMGVLLTTTGEGVLVGKLDPNEASVADDFDRMQLYSPNQVTNRNRAITVKLDEGSRADRTVSEEDGYTAIRVWRPDPFESWRADSAAKSSIPVLREIALYDDRIRATALSRLAGPGLLFINEDITLPVSMSDEEPQEDGTLDPFMVLMMEVMSTAMQNQDSAAARVPILIRAADPDSAAKLLTFDSPFDDKILELRKSALARFSTAVDMPAEILEGIGAMTHWTGALVSEEWKRSYLPELMGLFCGSLTSGWLLQAMARAGHGDAPADVIVWYDDSAVRTRENGSSDAQAAYDRGELSAAAFRRIFGYDEGDALDPTTEEGRRQLAMMIVLKAPAMAPVLADLLGLGDLDWSKIAPGGTTPFGGEAQSLPGQNPNTGVVSTAKAVRQEPNVGSQPTLKRVNPRPPTGGSDRVATPSL